MFHFDGSAWEQHDLPDSIIVHHIEGLSRDEVYVSGIWFPSVLEQIRNYRWDGVAWNLEESRYPTAPEPGFKSVFTLDQGHLHSNTETSISRRISKGIWQTLFTDPDASIAWMRAFGSTNIVAFGDDVEGFELLYHYDGRDWVRIEGVKRPNGNIVRAWAKDEQMFLISDDYSDSTMWPKTYVLRGE
jgi:hypothetical protein